ncbi:tyrosine-protein phosphatase [Streptomyces sp. NPDC101165]|uniref:tyrosine-protein phosphatase n=1 Tax=Streptomyces sp. NPDC101165 TaxID=3366119 RepID=UPI0038198248
MYRSESLAKIRPEGVTALAGLRLGSVIDLRTLTEVQADGTDRLPAGVTPVPQPVDDTSLFAFIANRAALGAAVRTVANSTKPVLFHCSAGKDRTGVVADTILRAVGVPASTAEIDYLLSNQLRAASDQALRDQLKAAGYMQNPDLLIPLQEVRSDYLAAFRDQAVHDYGSFGAFLINGLGLDGSTLTRLRGRLVG